MCVWEGGGAVRVVVCTCLGVCGCEVCEYGVCGVCVVFVENEYGVSAVCVGCVG